MARAIAYVFGDTLICDDAETAKLVTFADSVHTRSVTLDGDIYDPTGTLSGGSAPNSSHILIQVQELLEIESKLRDAQTRLGALEKEEQKSRNMRNSWRDLARDLEIKEHGLKLLEEQVGGSNASLVSTPSVLENLVQVLICSFLFPYRTQVKSRKSKSRSRTCVSPSRLPKRSKRMLKMTARSSNAIWTNSRTTRMVRLKSSKYVISGFPPSRIDSC